MIGDMTEPVRSAFVWQAAWMISAQLGITLDNALNLLEVSAVGHDRPLVEVAQDVVEQRIHFEPPEREKQEVVEAPAVPDEPDRREDPTQRPENME
jgi:hypothetical protein